MNRSIPPVGTYLLLALIFAGVWGFQWLYFALFISNGVSTQGVIVNTQVVTCVKGGESETVWIRFTDRGGRVHTISEGGCPQPFPGSPGDAVTLVYNPNNPSQIIPPGNQPYSLLTLVSGLIALLLLPFWIRKRMRKPKHLEAWSLSDYKGPPLFHE